MHTLCRLRRNEQEWDLPSSHSTGEVLCAGQQFRGIAAGSGLLPTLILQCPAAPFHKLAPQTLRVYFSSSRLIFLRYPNVRSHR